MIDWLLRRQGDIVRYSRWIVVGCALALFGVSRLPRTPLDRVLAIAVVVTAGTVFAVWLVVTLVTLLMPGLFNDLRRHRAAARAAAGRAAGV